MKLNLQFILILIAAGGMVVGCNKGPSTTGAGSGTSGTVAPSETASSSYDGEYVFDTQAFRKTLNEDASLKNVPADLIESMLSKFDTFKIEVKGADTIVTFGSDVIKGKLVKESESDGAMKFKMTPSDEDKKEDIAFFIFKEKTLTLDPGKGDEDRLYFVKK